MKRNIRLKSNFFTRVFSSILMSLIIVAVSIAPMMAQQAVDGSSEESSSQSNGAPANLPPRTLFLPVLDNNSCNLDFVNRARNHFGVQVYGYMGPRSPYYCDLVASGATWLRNFADWSSAEPANVPPDQYRWQLIDRAVEAARIGRFKQILTIDYNPSWAATDPHGVIDKVPLSEFVSFVGALVERYDGDGIDDAPGSPIVEYFEFYNEPDAGFAGVNDIRWGDHGKEYAEMLAAVYPAVKAANPNAKVLLGGIAYDWFTEHNGPFVKEFLDVVLANGGGAYFDIMNFHQYPPFAPNWGSQNGPGLVEKTTAVRSKLAEYGLSKPIQITESGMHSNTPESPERQARYVTMLYTQALVADVDVLIWFMLYDPGVTYPFRNGLVTSVSGDNPRPQRKPAFKAYQTAVFKFAGAQYERTLTVDETGDPDLLAYQFRDRNGNKMVVAWLGPIGRTDAKPLVISGASATVTDIYGVGRGVNIGSSQNTGTVTALVGAQPTYIHINR